MNRPFMIIMSVIVSVAAARSASPQVAKNTIAVPLCKILLNPTEYNGKMVRVHANFGGTWEGMYLFDLTCSPNLPEGEDEVLVANTDYPGLGIHPPVKFIRNAEWNKFERSESRLCNALESQCAFDYITADFTGLLIARTDFQSSKTAANGFGHLGMAREALILQSVANVRPHKHK